MFSKKANPMTFGKSPALQSCHDENKVLPLDFFYKVPFLCQHAWYLNVVYKVIHLLTSSCFPAKAKALFLFISTHFVCFWSALGSWRIFHLSVQYSTVPFLKPTQIWIIILCVQHNIIKIFICHGWYTVYKNIFHP